MNRQIRVFLGDAPMQIGTLYFNASGSTGLASEVCRIVMALIKRDNVPIV